MSRRKNILKICVVMLMIMGMMFNHGIEKVGAADSINVQIEGGSTYVGQEITVKVNVSSADNMGGALSLTYDSSLLAPVGSASGIISSTNSSFSVTFVTLKIGFTRIGVDKASWIYSGNNSDPELSVKNGLIIVAEGNTDILPPTVPETQPPTTEADKEPDGGNENQPTIPVVDNTDNNDNGGNNGEQPQQPNQPADTQAQTNVTIAEPETVAATEPATVVTPGDNIVVTLGDGSYTIDKTLTGKTLPAGYILQNTTIAGTTVKTGYNTNNKVTLCYLTANEAGKESGFYVYNSQTSTYTKYMTLGSSNALYVLLNYPDNIADPQGLTRTMVSLSNHAVVACIDAANPTYAVFYGVNASGVEGLYRYAAGTAEIKAYNQNETQTATQDKNAGTIATVTKASTERESVAQYVPTTKSTGNRDKIIILVAVVLLVIAIILFIFFAKPRKPLGGKPKKKNKKNRNIYDEDDEEEFYTIDEENEDSTEDSTEEDVLQIDEK